MRTLVAGLVALLAGIIAPLAVATVWTERTVTEPERYLEVVSAVSAEAEVQQAVRDQLIEVVLERVDPGPLAAPLVERAVTRAVDRVLADERFPAFWLDLNRAVHAQVTGTLSGQGATADLAPDGTLTVHLGPIVEALTEQLTAAGIPVPAELATDESVELVRSPELALVQSSYDGLVLASTVAPWVGIGMLVLALALARRRAMALVVAGITSAAVGFSLLVVVQQFAISLQPVVAEKLATTMVSSLEPALLVTVAVSAGMAALGGLVWAVSGPVRVNSSGPPRRRGRRARVASR